jgi:MFS transporter, MHS family, alpha-ketoglutarate permease
LFVFALVQPLFGLLSDYIGRKPLLIGFGLLGSVLTVPLLSGLSKATSANGAFILIMAGLLIVSGYTSINAIVKAELYPTAIRTLGVGLPYAVTTALFGGTAEYVALWFKNRGNESYFYWYVSFCILASLVVYLAMQDTKINSRLND